MLVELISAFVLSTILSGIVEFIAHKYILHGLGKKKNSFFFYHWQHHFECRKNKNADKQVYNKNVLKNLFKLDTWKEIASLITIVFLNTPLLFVWPTLFYCILFWTTVYYVLHYFCHAFPMWGKKWMRHHFDHHMGKNQDANFGVTLPLIDYIMGTRIKYKYDKNEKCLGIMK